MLKYKYMHSIWHLFVLGGVVMHYYSILELLNYILFLKQDKRKFVMDGENVVYVA